MIGLPGTSTETRDSEREREARLKIRQGLRLVLRGLEELWLLPYSFDTKGEQGRRSEN